MSSIPSVECYCGEVLVLSSTFHKLLLVNPASTFSFFSKQKILVKARKSVCLSKSLLSFRHQLFPAKQPQKFELHTPRHALREKRQR